MKLIHIFSDKKFLADSKSFNSEFITVNDSIIVENELSLKKVKKMCLKYDVVVLHQLDSFKIALANSLPQSIKIAWRFYGVEIYNRHQTLFLSQRIKKIQQSSSISIFYRIINSLKYRIPLWYKKHILSYDFDFQKAIGRINLILILFKEEYKVLKELEPNIPEFLEFKLSFSTSDLKFTNNNNSKKIIVGNSRNIYNNHIDILEITKKHTTNYNFIMPFNYGTINEYSKIVTQLALDQNYGILTDFIDYDDYNELIKSADTMVSNAHRQMAMGNIYLGLKYGLKIYLNKNNSTYSYLLNSGFLVFDISNLDDDLLHNAISLSEKEKEHNVLNFNNIFDKTNLNYFADEFVKILK